MYQVCVKQLITGHNKMVERIQDLNLPNSNITKIIKDSLPADVNMDKEARIAIARATSVFIMYVSSNAAAIAHKQSHKTFSAQDVLKSISEMDFKSFIAPMKGALITYQKSMKDKKDNKKSLEARKSLVLQQDITITPIPSISSAKVIMANPPTQSSPFKQPVTISSDVIEIDDSD